MNRNTKRIHPPIFRWRNRIFLILIPILYSIWFALINVRSMNYKSTQNEMISPRSFSQASSWHDTKITQKSADNSTETSDNTSCFRFNSHAWVRGPRLGNANNSSGIDPRFAKEIILASVHWRFYENLSTLMKQSICESQSRFIRMESTRDGKSDLRLWVVRLIYMYLHYHQDHHAFQETTVLEPRCIQEREAVGIGPYDFECPDAKFLVVRFYNNGIGANMRYSAVPSLMAGLATNRVVLFVNNSPVGPSFVQQPWSQVSCERGDAQCFFLPASPCVLTHEEIQNAYSLQKRERRTLFRTGTLPENRKDDRVILLQLPFRPQRIPENLRENIYNRTLPLIHDMIDPLLQRTLLEAASLIRNDDIPTRNESFSYYGMDSPLFHALLLYSLRPNPRAATRMDEILNEIIPREFESSDSIGLPIRGSDKCDTEMECMSFQNHLRAAEEFWQSFKSLSDPLIIITTESKKIREEMELFQHNKNMEVAPRLLVNYLDITQNTGYFEPLSSNDTRKIDETDEVILSAMSSLKVQLLPKLTLGNCCSSFHLMLKDILSEGCGAHPDHVFQCLQAHENPRYRTCCSWDKSPECIARRENGSSFHDQ